MFQGHAYADYMDEIKKCSLTKIQKADFNEKRGSDLINLTSFPTQPDITIPLFHVGFMGLDHGHSTAHKYNIPIKHKHSTIKEKHFHARIP